MTLFTILDAEATRLQDSAKFNPYNKFLNGYSKVTDQTDTINTWCIIGSWIWAIKFFPGCIKMKSQFLS